MRLSVIIVNYNVQHFLEQCLHSVRKAASTINTEIFVVDNNSVDGSVAMVRLKFPEVKLIENKTNTGFSYANNQAIKRAEGEYLLLLNPDTVVEEDTFCKVIAFMDEHPEAGGLGVKMLDGKGYFLPESKRGLPTPAVAFYKIVGLAKLFPQSKKFGRYHLGFLDKDEIHEVDVLSGAFMLLRKSTIDKVGLLDEAFFMYGEDIDLSYRIQLGGYKNFYFPKTRIIHYKGESTKKSSVNYVFVFYNAMLIFAQKHFTKNNAKTFAFLINIAIYIRATMAIAKRFLMKALVPLMDGIVILAGLFAIKNYYEHYVKFTEGEGAYSPLLVWVAFLSYVFIWLFSVLLNSGYDRPIRIGKIIRGVGLGTVVILIVYALLPENYRFSRALILLGSAWAAVALVGLRLLFHLLKLKGYSLTPNKNKNIAVIGGINECERVSTLLKKTGLNEASLFFVSIDEQADKSAKIVGRLQQIKEIIEVYKIDELIFCAQDLTAQLIIAHMSLLENCNVDYKIAPPESISIIGSNSIHTSGDLYVVDINSVNKPANLREKRIFDCITSGCLLLTFPVVVLLMRSPAGLFTNILQVMFGAKSWIGYNTGSSQATGKKGVLKPADIFGEKITEEEENRLNVNYSNNYSINKDIVIFFRCFRQLGN